MKINCYQVAPEYQESPLFYCFPLDISIFGNHQFRERFSDEVESIMKVLRDSTFTWALDCCESTDERREQLKDWFPEMPELEDVDIETLTSDILHEERYDRVFTYLTGHEYDMMEIRGSRQRDWNYMYYLVDDYPEYMLRHIEIEYWDEGTQWECEMDNDEFISIYTHSCYLEKQRVEIAEELGVDPLDIVLHKFVGWKRTAEYQQC